MPIATKVNLKQTAMPRANKISNNDSLKSQYPLKLMGDIESFIAERESDYCLYK